MRTYEIHQRVLSETQTAAVRATLTADGIGDWIGDAYGAVAHVIAASGLSPIGPPYARYHRGNGSIDVEAGFPIADRVREDGPVVAASLPGGTAIVTTHVGPYDQMEPAYDALRAWAADHGYVCVGDAWETYFSDPASTPDPAHWRTEIVQPVIPNPNY